MIRALRFALPVAALLAFVTSSIAGAAEPALSASERRLVARIEANRERTIELLRRVVDQASATENLAGVRQVGEILAAELAQLGFETTWMELAPEIGRAGHLVAEIGRKGGSGPRILKRSSTRQGVGVPIEQISGTAIKGG